MKRVFVAAHPIEARFAADALGAAGIETVVRGEHLFAIRGGVPLTEDTLPSVWVVEPEEYQRAVDLLRRIEGRDRLRPVEVGTGTSPPDDERKAPGR